MRPQLIVVAGPNGAGKSTYSRTAFNREFLLLDPDRFGLLPEDNHSLLSSARAVIRRVRSGLEAGESFVLETTLSGKYPMAVLRQARHLGFEVTLIYVGLDDAEECIFRIKRRVAEGGHAVPDADVRRRLPRSIANLGPALRYADRARIIDNSSRTLAYREVADVLDGRVIMLGEAPPWVLPALEGLRGTE